MTPVVRQTPRQPNEQPSPKIVEAFRQLLDSPDETAGVTAISCQDSGFHWDDGA